MTGPWYIRDAVRVGVVYQDETAFGSALGLADESIRRACSAVFTHREQRGMDEVVATSEILLRDAFSRGLAPLYERPGVLRPECLHPCAEEVRPVELTVACADAPRGKVPLDGAMRGELACWLGELQRGAPRPVTPTGRAFFDGLEALGVLTTEPPEPDVVPPSDVLFVGHATALVGHRVLVDPFVLPRSQRYPATYQPLRVSDLPPVEAVFITHSHPDHFDPGTLLTLGHDVPIYVPHVERESLLSVDMERRLRELGFSNVHPLKPGTSVTVDGVTAHARPFFGEQPTTSDVYHPEVRNVGCTYLFEFEGRRHLFVADSGTDREGDVRDVASTVRRSEGPVDVLFGGYRAFAVYPIHYLFSSVARYLLFVPEHLWNVRQETMNDASALLDTAERCAAGRVVPYADGGAPWYWERGLGPRLDQLDEQNPAVDPHPEAVSAAAATRSSSRQGPIRCPVPVQILRPGEGLVMTAGVAATAAESVGAGKEDQGVRVTRGPHQVWPYAPRRWTQLNVALVRTEGSALPSARALFDRLEPWLAARREEGRLDRFFFMRKPPDVRLRLEGEASLEQHAGRLLDQLVRQGCVARWFPSVYEPELERFGGAGAMDALHSWFDMDATQWMRLERARSTGSTLVGAERRCAAVASDLVFATLSDAAERAEVWRTYATRYGSTGLDAGLAPGVTRSLAPEALGSAPDTQGALSNGVTELEHTVLAAYREANRLLAETLLRLWQQGELKTGIRSVLVDAILFHFHRHGLEPSAHARIARSMVLDCESDAR